jgi:hypothetical protein
LPQSRRSCNKSNDKLGVGKQDDLVESRPNGEQAWDTPVKI